MKNSMRAKRFFILHSTKDSSFSKPVLVNLRHQLLVPVLQLDVCLKVAVDGVCLGIKFDDGELARLYGFVEQSQGAVHQDDIVRLHRLAQLLHFVETGMHVCRRLQAGIVQRQAGTLHLQAGYFPFVPVGKQGQASTYQETVAFLVKRRCCACSRPLFWATSSGGSPSAPSRRHAHRHLPPINRHR